MTHYTVGSGYTVVSDAFALAAALESTRGCYQRGLISGYEALSGATLRGKASKYGAHYRASAKNLVARLARDSRLSVREERREHGKRVLVIESRIAA